MQTIAEPVQLTIPATQAHPHRIVVVGGGAGLDVAGQGRHEVADVLLGHRVLDQGELLLEGLLGGGETRRH